ncbi:MAG: DUF1735 domain-containing protein [Bacteroidetes bacterium]|nr:DUF1735 domain-containing protein [Bacteroidota bacterium]
MKHNSIIKFLMFMVGVAFTTSCLDDGHPLLPAGDGGGSFTLMTYNTQPNQSNYNSGLSATYFSNGALTFPLGDAADSVNFAVSLQGPTLGKDMTVTITIDNSRLQDNFANDELQYVAMPDSVYDIPEMTGVIKAGQMFVDFKLKVYPKKFDGQANYMLPITATNDANVPMAENYAVIYVHTIGNPLAGTYKWDFTRCSDPACAGGPDGQSFTGNSATFAPASGTKLMVPTGYYDHANYIITFVNNGGATLDLSNFKAVLDPASVNGAWAAAGIVVVKSPSITVNSTYTDFTLNYTTLTRNCTDRYYK